MFKKAVGYSLFDRKPAADFWLILAFFVKDAPEVKFFSLGMRIFLSWRERAAVDAWIESNKWFYTMHDSYTIPY